MGGTVKEGQRALHAPIVGLASGQVELPEDVPWVELDCLPPNEERLTDASRSREVRSASRS
jgi:hypothetical protein